MPKHGKRYNELVKTVDTHQAYEPEAALDLVKKTANAKFDETVRPAKRQAFDPLTVPDPHADFISTCRTLSDRILSILKAHRR